MFFEGGVQDNYKTEDNINWLDCLENNILKLLHYFYET